MAGTGNVYIELVLMYVAFQQLCYTVRRGRLQFAVNCS